MTHIFAKEMRARQITVNTFAPWPTDTPLFNEGRNREQIDGVSKMAPLERLGDPVDIANAVSFLAGPDGAWSTGRCCVSTAASSDLTDALRPRSESAVLAKVQRYQREILKSALRRFVRRRRPYSGLDCIALARNR